MDSQVCRIPSLAARVAVCALLGLAGLSISAQESGQTIPEPGFRPPSDQAAAFLDAVGDMSVDVLPTLIRRLDRTAHSFSSQQQIVDFLNAESIATATARRNRIDLGGLERASQLEIFQRGIAVVAEAVKGPDTGPDYTLVTEVLVPFEGEVFGVEVYILDREGRNAFSYLLNSHHQIFVAARLVSSDSSEAARQEMIASATRVALSSLQAQIQDARECAQREVPVAPKANAGVVHDFGGALVSGTDEWGTPLGYSIFSGPETTVSFAVADTYPARSGANSGNRVLQIDVNSSSWGGVIHRFTDRGISHWTPYDWQHLDGFSFWFHGENSGTELFVDILDNRRACSKTDDAERFRYRFWDDVAGWRLIKARFQDLAREDVGNGAPNDGLGLSRVHGWAFGSLRTDDRVRFFMDDFRLLDDASEAKPPDGARIVHGWMVETRLSEDVSRIEVSTKINGRPVVAKVHDLMCQCARLAIARGFEYFRADEREALSNDRARFRLTFFRTRPSGVPVHEPSDYRPDQRADVVLSAAVPARAYMAICNQ